MVMPLMCGLEAQKMIYVGRGGVRILTLIEQCEIVVGLGENNPLPCIKVECRTVILDQTSREIYILVHYAPPGSIEVHQVCGDVGSKVDLSNHWVV